MHSPPSNRMSVAKARDYLPELIAIRRKLHKYPELGFDVTSTASYISEILESFGAIVQSGVGGSGVVGIIKGRHPGKTVALRAELDALPIQEETNREYSSQVPGAMHACGHDLHVACLVGAAKLLCSTPDALSGNVVLIFQPAEETDAGAKAMISDGVLDDPPVDAIFALHNYPGLPTGTVAVKSGVIMASLDSIRIEIEGKGGHAAAPHEATDAIVVASSIVLHLQTVVSRNISPLSGGVVSIGTLHAGVASNIIADRAVMLGSARILDTDTRRLMPSLISRVVRNGAQALGAAGRVDYEFILPMVTNDASCEHVLRKAAGQLLGVDSVLEAPISMASDDFALYLEHVPGCYFWLGATERGSSPYVWHHPRFDIDEQSIAVGSAALAGAALEYLNN